MTITHFDRNRKSENKRASLPEEPPKKTRGKVTRNSSRQRAISKETRLTEPITSRKGQRIRNREDKRNSYTNQPTSHKHTTAEGAKDTYQPNSTK
jgi:hypothetical protein